MKNKLLKRVIFPFLVALGLSFTIGKVALFLGDKALEKDNLAKAYSFYKISKMANPIDHNTYKRELVINVLLKERAEESEETSTKTIANALPNRFVLGITTQVPVLMYHYIRVNPWPTDIVGFNLSVTPYSFASQLDYLQQHGYNTISLDQLGANLLYNAPLPPRPIVLTFDDGYEDFYTNAFPILKAHKMKAINFIITGFVGLPDDQNPIYLTWKQIEEMSKSGFIIFGAHTFDHKSLPSLSSDKAFSEILISKKDLEGHLNYPVNWLAYPYGDVNPRISDLAKKAGFIGAFGTQFGTFESQDTLFTESRVRVGGKDSPESLGARLPWR